MHLIHHPHLQWKFKLLVGKFIWGNKAKHCWVMPTNFWKQKVHGQCQAMIPLHLKQTFPPVIWIFTEGEGDGIKSRLPFKIISTLASEFSPWPAAISQKTLMTLWGSPTLRYVFWCSIYHKGVRPIVSPFALSLM